MTQGSWACDCVAQLLLRAKVLRTCCAQKLHRHCTDEAAQRADEEAREGAGPEGDRDGGCIQETQREATTVNRSLSVPPTPTPKKNCTTVNMVNRSPESEPEEAVIRIPTAQGAQGQGAAGLDKTATERNKLREATSHTRCGFAGWAQHA